MMHSALADGHSVDTLDPKNPVQLAELEAFIARRGDATPFHRPAWLLSVEQSTRNPAFLLVARNKAGAITAYLPLSHIRSRLFGSALASVGFAVDGGIICDDPAVASLLGDAAWRLAETLGVGSVELRGGPRPGPEWIAKSDSHLGFARPLAADEAEELSRIPRKHRAEVRKALGNEALTIEVGRKPRLLAEHYSVYAQTVHNLGTPVFPRSLLRTVAEAFGEDADVLIVRHDGRPVSAVLSLYHRGVVMPFWGGGGKAARALRANELMYFRLMDHARARGCAYFDFGRSKVDSGQAKWKASWGFEPRPLTYWLRAAEGQARDINPESAKYSSRVELWKKLPLPVANIVGPLLARGLG